MKGLLKESRDFDKSYDMAFFEKMHDIKKF